MILTHKEGDDGPEEILKIIDFSIAKLEGGDAVGEQRVTEPGALVGTMMYMAPEQLTSGQASPASDVYALGLVLVEMLTGRLPRKIGDQESVDAALRRLITPESRFSRDLALTKTIPQSSSPSEELLQLASEVLHPDPQQRPADAGELLRRIKRLPEMSLWQKMQRRLEPNRTSYSDLSQLKYSPESAISTGSGDDPSWLGGKSWLRPQDDGDPTQLRSQNSSDKDLIELAAALAAEAEKARPIPEPNAPIGDGEEPTEKQVSAPIHIPISVEPTPIPLSKAPVQTAVVEPPALPAPPSAVPQEIVAHVSTGPTALSGPRRDDRTLRMLVLAACALISLLILFFGLKKKPAQNSAECDTKTANEIPSREPDLAKPALVNSLFAVERLDLGASGDLGSAVDLATADIAPGTSIKVRFYFSDSDDVSEVRCGARPMPETKLRHRVSIDVELQPGDVCKATSITSSRSKSWKYEELARKRVDQAGGRSIHVRFRDKIIREDEEGLLGPPTPSPDAPPAPAAPPADGN